MLSSNYIYLVKMGQRQNYFAGMGPASAPMLCGREAAEGLQGQVGTRRAF